MVNYIIRRLLLLIPVLCVVALVAFLVTFVLPGDPARMILGDFATQEEIIQLRERLGLDQPIHVQFYRWLSQIVRGDLGDSLFLRVPVTQAILSRIEPTFVLAVVGITIGTAIGIPLGVLAAIRHRTWIDQFAIIVSLGGISIPNFFLAILLILFLGVYLGWFPVAGYMSVFEYGPWALIYLVMPGLSLGFLYAGLIARMTRSSMLDVMGADYIRTARAKGLAEKVIIARHALKNALIPVVTVIGFSLALLLGGTWIIETMFNIPGTGNLAITAIMRRDFPIIQGSIIFIALIYLVVNLIVDLSYAFLNPRIKYK